MRKRFFILLFIIASLHFVSCDLYRSAHYLPHLEDHNAAVPNVTKHSDTTFSFGNNFLLKNKHRFWEMYIEGDPLQRGLISGALSQKLVLKQEAAFLSKLREMVPSRFKQRLLSQFLKIYNRKVYRYVPDEYQAEIYGLSQYVSPDYDHIATPFRRSLYLHAAHDIGHALTDLALVGCTSFAVWGDRTDDGSLLIARNMDFYAGDDFAQDKIVMFIKPDDGYPFMSVSWAGMAGVLSGMNMEGLTVTINAGKSDMPLIAKMPVSLLAREILQYAATIDEAVAIARQREVFVSESILVGSTADGKAVIIEVSPKKFGVYRVGINVEQIICSNHFQSEAYKNDKNNIATINDSHSQYRHERMQQLLQEHKMIDPVKAVEIIREREGLNGAAIGYGNEKAINQLLAHHSVVFKPQQRLVWVSSGPYQLGEFTAYDLNEIFTKRAPSDTLVSLAQEWRTIPEDEFLHSEAYSNYEEFRKQDRVIEKAINDKSRVLSSDYIGAYIALNPEYWKGYYNAGRYYYSHENYIAARTAFDKALTKEIATSPVKKEIEGYLNKIKSKME